MGPTDFHALIESVSLTCKRFPTTIHDLDHKLLRLEIAARLLSLCCSSVNSP